jgi:hypothetical protein
MVKILGFLAIAMVGPRAFGDLIYLGQARSIVASATIGASVHSQTTTSPDFSDFNATAVASNYDTLQAASASTICYSYLHSDELHAFDLASSGASESSLVAADSETHLLVTFTVDRTADYIYTAKTVARGGGQVMGWISTADARSEVSGPGIDITIESVDGPTGQDIKNVTATITLVAGQQYTLAASANGTVITGGRLPGSGYLSFPTPGVVGDYTIDLVPVPEPSTLVLLGLGVLVATALRGFQRAILRPTWACRHIRTAADS